jgi:hypothetical protein
MSSKGGRLRGQTQMEELIRPDSRAGPLGRWARGGAWRRSESGASPSLSLGQSSCPVQALTVNSRDLEPLGLAEAQISGPWSLMVFHLAHCNPPWTSWYPAKVPIQTAWECHTDRHSKTLLTTFYKWLKKKTKTQHWFL